MGWLKRWDERNRKYLDDLGQKPPHPKADLHRKVVHGFVAYQLLPFVIIGILFVVGLIVRLVS